MTQWLTHISLEFCLLKTVFNYCKNRIIKPYHSHCESFQLVYFVEIQQVPKPV